MYDYYQNTKHQNRKYLKGRAKPVLKKHYGIFLVACLVAALLGTEFTGSIEFISIHAQEAMGLDDNDTDNASTGFLISQQKQIAIVGEMLSGNTDHAKEQVNQSDNQGNEEKGNQVFGRKEGVLASLVNSVHSGSFIVSGIVMIKNLTGSQSVATIIFIILAALASLAFWVFVINIYQVVMRRVFLEGRIYDKVRSQRFLFLIRVKGWIHAAWVVLLTSVLYFFWSLTIVGIVVKYYSYYMVPYIVAENPGIPALDAITLSRRMMKGHKWECFLLNVSFLGWWILGVITAGVTSLFFANMYIASTEAEYYAALREQYLLDHPEAMDVLNDRYLFEKPSEEVLNNAYADAVAKIRNEQNEQVDLKGVQGFFAETFGVVLWNNRKEQAYEDYMEQELLLRNYEETLEGLVYPGRLYPRKEREKRKRVETIHYLRNYSLMNLVLLFFMMSCTGWIWEVTLHLIEDGRFVNRGVSYGPWLPIYGAGGILILVLLNKFRRYPAVEFLTAVVLCGVVEYVTSYYLEVTHNGMKWWDYSGYFLNLNGRICAEGLLVFGMGGVAFVYLVAPMMDNLLKKVSPKVLMPIAVVLLLSFGVDNLYSSKHPNTGKGITDYAFQTPGQTAWNGNEEKGVYIENTGIGTKAVPMGGLLVWSGTLCDLTEYNYYSAGTV